MRHVIPLQGEKHFFLNDPGNMDFLISDATKYEVKCARRVYSSPDGLFILYFKKRLPNADSTTKSIHRKKNPVTLQDYILFI
jgi:hypothetical protein